LAALALTDHDCLDGFEAFRSAAEGFLPIPGVEVSARDREADVHILGLFVDPDHETLRARLRELAQGREDRLDAMLERLVRAGVRLTREDVEAHSPRGTTGRPHIALALVATGAARNVDDAFRRWLRPHTPGYVQKPGPDPAEAIAWIHDAGGVAVLAHPGIGRTLSAVERYAAHGLDGLEVWHPKHGTAMRESCLALAQRLGLVPAGGSDYHGPRVGDSRVGQEPVPLEVLERLRERCPRR
jgi:predicted metal-dependent phosphoesterase TrpH